MKKTLSRLFALLLAAAMVLSMVSCKKNKTPNTTSSSKVSSVEAPSEPDSEPTDASDDGDVEDPDEPIVDPTEEDPTASFRGATAVTGDLSTGVMLNNADNDDPDNNGDDDPGDDLDTPDDIDNETITYDPIIQMAGKAVASNKREVKINNSKQGVVYTDFNGLNCNVYPTHGTLLSQQYDKTSDAYMELDGKRFNDIAGRYARSWFQIDWMITDEAGDDYEKYDVDWDKNPDYQNYYKGVYDFDSEAMQSAIDYWKMLDEADTEVYLAFGWKIATRIQAWFGSEPSRPQIAAPRDLDAYAKAAVALYKYCRNEVGLTNFKTLAFYNEPDRADSQSYNGSWDYVTIGDKCTYWAMMARACKKAFAKEADLKDVTIWGADCSNNMTYTSDQYVNPYLRKYASDAVDVYTFHYYHYHNDRDSYHDSMDSTSNYESLFKTNIFVSNWYSDHPCYITEYYACDKDIEKDYRWDNKYAGWNGTIASFLTACANAGVHGAFKWSFVGNFLLDPLFFNPANGDFSSWVLPTNPTNSKLVQYSYYEEAMMNNYIPRRANVQDISWTGNDIRGTAFTSENHSDFSLMIEAEDNLKVKDLRVSLTESLGGRTLYVYKFDYNNIKKDANATIPALYDKLQNIGKSFSYELDGDYGLYIFTTIKPLKQVELYTDVTNEVAASFEIQKDDVAKIKAKLIDCEPGDTVSWEIKRYSGAVKYEDLSKKLEYKRVAKEKINGADLGTITNGTNLSDGGVMTYTPAADAESGEVVALRCTINGTAGDRYATAIIHIS